MPVKISVGEEVALDAVGHYRNPLLRNPAQPKQPLSDPFGDGDDVVGDAGKTPVERTGNAVSNPARESERIERQFRRQQGVRVEDQRNFPPKSRGGGHQ